MAITAPTQVSTSTVDATGLSAATSVKDGDRRVGMAYDPTVMAAAVPIWFHPLRNGQHLMVNSRRWYDVPPSGVSADGAYTEFSEDLTPSWRIIDGPTGAALAVPGSVNIPTRLSVTTPRLVGAASRPPTNIYLLTSVEVDGSPAAMLQNFYVSNTDSFTLSGEEVLPSVASRGNTLVFDKGVQFQGSYIKVYGTNASGAVFCIRKMWSHVGVNSRDDQLGIKRGTTPVWEYFTGTGFSEDPTELGPTELASAGPLSFASCQNVVVASTVAQDGTVFTGEIWQSLAGRAFQRVKQGIALGDSSDGTYLGAGVPLMDQLRPSAVLQTARGGIPYVVTTKYENTGASTLRTNWDMWVIPR